MAIATSQQITRYYDLYRDKEITFTKDIIRTLGMDPRQIFIKCAGAQWPCIINSTSFQQARIIIGTKGGAFQLVAQKNPPTINLRFCFFENETQLLTFFITSKVTNITPYMNSKDLVIITLTFTQRPPDDLIEKVGHLLEANVNFLRRKEERITINEDSKRKLNIPKEETLISIQNVPRHCILRDISFGGAKVILLGIAQYLVGKDIILCIEFDEPQHEYVLLKGKVMNADQIQGRNDLVAINIKYEENSIPLSYKLHVNNFIATQKIKMLSTDTKIINSNKTEEPQNNESSKPANTVESEEKNTTESLPESKDNTSNS